MSVVRAADLDLTSEDVSRAATLFGIADVERLGGFENVLFRSSDPPGRILRLTHTSRRNAEMIHAEFEFMAHLADQGVPVVAPIRSLTGQLVEEIETASGDDLVVACMTEAPGRFRRGDDWSDAEIETYGELLAAMHEAAEEFTPSGVRRPAWTDPVFDVGFSHLEASDPELFGRVAEVRTACAAHDAGGSWLLIHQDAHLGNLHITDNGHITLFDFDDCAYGTPTHDVAIVLFYWLMGVDQELPTATQRFISRFMRGYERHRTLPGGWPDGADLFLSLRELDIYCLIQQEPSEEVSPMEERFMAGRRDRILDRVPYLGVSLANIL